MSGFIIFLVGFVIFISFSKPHKVALLTISNHEKDYFHNYLMGRFIFYTKLSPELQKKFLYRVLIVKKINKIKVHHEIIHQHKDIDLLVSAAFAQITFGYTDFMISSFTKIIIYPDSFYSKLANNHVNGLTIGNGYIFLSWTHFLKGYIDSDDKVNLALHELAHALYMDRFHYKRDRSWMLWEENAHPVYQQICNNDEIKFFRAYAKTNMAEFWAVCVECFFEDPVNFNSEFPELYRATANLLQQDMLYNSRLAS